MTTHIQRLKPSPISPKVSKDEAEKIFAGKNAGDQSVESDLLDSVLDDRYKREIDHLLELRKQQAEMSLKERRNALNASTAVTGVLGVWSLIGIVMLAKSCINTDPGPKFKV